MLMSEYRSQKEIDPEHPRPLRIFPMLLLVGAGFLATATLFNEFVTKPYWQPYLGNYSLRLAALSEHGGSVNAVFVGSSHLLTAVNPLVVDAADGSHLRSFNLSIVASSLASERNSLKFLVEADLPELRYVFIEPMMMPANYRNAFSNRIRYFWTSENTRIAAQKHWNSNLPLWESVADLIKTGLTWQLHMANFGVAPDILDPRLPSKKVIETTWEARGHTPWKGPEFDSDFTKLPDLNTLYRERSESEMRVIDEYLQLVDATGARPVFIFPPVRRNVGRLRAIRDGVAQRYPDVPILDYLPDTNPLPLYFEKSMWGDWDHINKAGAARFSKILSTDIEQLDSTKAPAKN
jgi:hypothetical protein